MAGLESAIRSVFSESANQKNGIATGRKTKGAGNRRLFFAANFR
jgi:hypothetical protein